MSYSISVSGHTADSEREEALLKELAALLAKPEHGVSYSHFAGQHHSESNIHDPEHPVHLPAEALKLAHEAPAEHHVHTETAEHHVHQTAHAHEAHARESAPVNLVEHIEDAPDEPGPAATGYSSEDPSAGGFLI